MSFSRKQSLKIAIKGCCVSDINQQMIWSPQSNAVHQMHITRGCYPWQLASLMLVAKHGMEGTEMER